MKRTLLLSTVILSFCILTCKGQDISNTENRQIDSSETLKTNEMKSFISIFEIPATEISRAVDFYQTILDISIEKMEFPEMQMGIFPYEGQMVTGVIMRAEGYKPSADGVTIYLNGGDNLQIILDKVEKNGGEIIVPKSLHADESGYYALFLDSEGNKIGLHSPN
ncbi:VOC family protein [uncultured Kriegella sp.]|uniref:VOC family protein n=1 Tax=uncultured Kriegella sp. TaxID=1798910 RepID=UPI0030DC0DEA|tara:strand:+ start:4596 stop:5090 length:495 start_codon:yes stop_codon:yes gene_type:complete